MFETRNYEVNFTSDRVDENNKASMELYLTDLRKLTDAIRDESEMLRGRLEQLEYLSSEVSKEYSRIKYEITNMTYCDMKDSSYVGLTFKSIH